MREWWTLGQPYIEGTTIIKARENWTKQEHDKFFEALQLYVAPNYFILGFCLVYEKIRWGGGIEELCVCFVSWFWEKVGKNV